MLRHVRQNVMAATGQRQRPWTQSCLGVEGFIFRPKKELDDSAAPGPAAALAARRL